MLFRSVAIRKEKNNRAVFRYVCGVCSSVCLEVLVNHTGDLTLVAGSWEGHTESRTSGSPRGPTSAVHGVERTRPFFFRKVQENRTGGPILSIEKPFQ